ncbi:MAG: transposase [Spiribacter salinus]|uniref:Transposase n=1 Tax=Spiribacter salinus TaxID=1335746 RepID=A0A540VND7_9GAMM|nr:MAG: transposase [Spiribacter salinus]
MPYPRHAQISTQTTPYYHCVSRCVRRAFLCGWDRLTGRNYEHRKQWVVDRLRLLGAVFCIDICAYAVMANHHHVVLRLNLEQAAALTEDEVLARWARVFGLPMLAERYRQGESASEVEAETAREWIAAYLERLADLSWFMRCLNEPIARWANAEDGVTGRFWEGRFRSQALLDEAALLTCMSYVDLNPMRAAVAETPEDSDHTAIQARIRDWAQAPGAASTPDTGDKAPTEAAEGETSEVPPDLLPFRGPERDGAPDHLPFAFADYLELVDWVGRAVRDGKRGAIAADAPPILARLGIDPEAYLDRMGRRRQPFIRAIGRAHRLRQAATEWGQRYIKGIRDAKVLFPVVAG